MRALTSALLLGAAIACAPATARAFCRTTTCSLPPDFDPTQGCVPAGLDRCTDGQGDTIKNIPLWWKSACAGYSVQKDASKYVSLADAEKSVADAFAQWSSASCATGKVGIDVQFLGPVTCADGTYKTGGPNQNAVIFRDAAWPHKSAAEQAAGVPSPEIALTTVSFDPFSGEIYGAYVEINNADHIVKPTTSPSGDTFDLNTVLVHEAGHFLGMAHSASHESVMYFADREGGGAGAHRTLSADDVDGICAAYPPGGARFVDPSVDPSGKVQATACDATPRHGFSSDCTASAKSGCSCRHVGRGGEGSGVAAVVTALGLAVARRRNLRRGALSERHALPRARS